MVTGSLLVIVTQLLQAADPISRSQVDHKVINCFALKTIDSIVHIMHLSHQYLLIIFLIDVLTLI